MIIRCRMQEIQHSLHLPFPFRGTTMRNEPSASEHPVLKADNVVAKSEKPHKDFLLIVVCIYHHEG